MTWEEIIEAVKQRNPLMYKAPLDHEHTPIRYIPSLHDRTIKIIPFPGNNFDPFDADEGHADRFRLDTHLAPEEHAYPNGGQTRKGQAIFPDGRVRRVWGGIPDSAWTIPAHGWMKGKSVRGHIGCINGVWTFHPYTKKVTKTVTDVTISGPNAELCQ